MSNQHLISDRYRIDELLSEGGMGAVYRGVDIHSGQHVAIKLLKPEMVVGQADMVERFSREAVALRALNHPNIVKVLSTITEADKQYIVMEYVSGGSLRDLLDREGQLSINRTLELTLDLADALTRSHRLEIIHRDLKPANVLLADDGTPRLSDFGLAIVGSTHLNQAPSLTQAGTILGTIDYLSPEACRGEVLDARTDIWALGVMLFEMLVGFRPFSKQPATPTFAAILSAILTQPIPDLEELLSEAPDALVDLIYRMLTKEHEARIPSMRLVGAELESIIQGREISQQYITTSHAVQPRFAKPSSHSSRASQSNLPVQVTPFIGRETELADVAKLIDDPNNRLITLLGPGGVGKTRLAIESARSQMPKFENGVTFVPLAPLTSAEEIIPAIAEAVGYQFFEHMEPREQLINYFREKQTLLLLDNFEHMLDEVNLVSEILVTAPGIKVLATSREKLNLHEEIRFWIDGMDFPEGVQPTSLEEAFEYSAIRLFLQAAKRARPAFELEIEDLKHITHICRLVSGMPLGILLAASWVELFSPQEIAEEVSQSLDFLETEVSDIPERHRSIRAVFDSSWSQLSEAERATFMKLAVFRSGFRREAAQAVAGASLQKLLGLVRKSLLHRDPTSGRYEVHELLRQYAEEQLEVLGKAEAARDAHCGYYSTFMEERLEQMLGPGQQKALDEIETEFGNVRQAWHWAVEWKDFGAIEHALESLFVYSDMRSREHEGVELIGTALERLSAKPGEEPHPIWGRLLLTWYDLLLQSKGRPEEVKEIKKLGEINLELAQERDDLIGIAYGLVFLGHFAKPADAINMYKKALDLVPRLDDSFWVRIRIGFCFRALGEHQKEIQAFQQSYQRGQELGEQEKMGWSLYNLGKTEIYMGDHINALTHLREANAHFRQVGTLFGIIWTNVNLSLLTFLAGNIKEARSLVDEAQEIARNTNWSKAIKKQTLIILGFLELIKQDYQSAEYHFREVLSAYPTTPEASLGLTYAACGQEDYKNASRYLPDALQPTTPYLIPAMVILCLPAGALIMMNDGKVEQAVELLAQASDHPQVSKDLLKKLPLLTHLRAELETELDPQAIDVLWARGQRLDLTAALTMLADHFHPEAHPQQPLSTGKPILPTLGIQPLVEPLSTREMEVLQLLKTELTGPEIADELNVSLNTLRFHTKNIYSKLQVNNRRSALNRAMDLGL